MKLSFSPLTSLGGAKSSKSQAIAVLVSDSLSLSGIAADIDKHTRGWEKPSDHVPVWADLDLETA